MTADGEALQIMNEISKTGHHMWKCDGLFGNVSVLQQFYLTFKNYRLCFSGHPVQNLWIAQREQQILLVIYFVLDKKESSCDIYGFSFNCIQNSPVLQLLYMDLRKSLSQRVYRKVFNCDENKSLFIYM